MKRYTHNCNNIKAASQRGTNNIFLPYRTPILQGAISIIKDFEKNKDDGVDYLNLCDELNKYVNIQKECIDPSLKNKNMSLFITEWGNTIKGIRTTFTSKDINRLCYWEGDKKERDKKDVLFLHDKFRKFCIEKKKYEAISSNMEPNQCVSYIQWIAAEKEKLLSVDPGYNTIKKYQKYFDIRNNCNYPWLLKYAPDITCSVRTKTKPKEQVSTAKTSADTSQSTPDVGRAIPAGDTKVNPDPTQPPSTGVVVPLDDKTTSIHHEKTPIQRNTSDAADTNKQSNVPSPDVQGNPIPMTIPVFQPIKFSEHPKFDDFIKTLSTNFHGQKISYVYQPFKQSPIRIPKAGTSNVRGESIKPIMTRSYNYVPVKFPRKQGKFPKHLNIQPLPEFIPRSKIFPKIIPDSMRYLDKIPPLKNYSHKYISMKSSVPIFLRNNPNHENAPASGNKNMDIVNIELPTPDASYFRSPLLISVLAFLILSTIITTLFLLFKYTSFGWLFGKKKKKKSLKRQLKIKKISEEHPHFDNTSNYSIKDIPYEKTTHNDKNIYSKIKMQKAIIKENVTLQKGKKNNRKAIIDIHMELLNEYKNDEWELNKNDFLQICLEEFVREQNKIYSNSENTNLVMKNISIQNTKDKMVLLDKWTERCRPIWEKFKSENAFKVLQNEWKKEEMEYLENIEQFENIILNENTKFSYKEIKKEIWRKCITKQAKFMEQFKQEKWFKSLVKQIEDVSDEYKMGEINDGIFVLNIEKLDNINNNEESYKHDNNPFLIKVLTQIFMMVIEECIKEESPEKTELVLDNIIEKLNKEKHAKIESQNIHQENMNNKEYNETLEKDTHKYKDSFKELMEGWTNKTYIDVNSADDKNKSDKWVEMTDKNFLNPNDDISENPIHYIRE